MRQLYKMTRGSNRAFTSFLYHSRLRVSSLKTYKPSSHLLFYTILCFNHQYKETTPDLGLPLNFSNSQEEAKTITT